MNRMDDTISRQAAIDAIVNTPSEVQNKNIPLVDQYDGATFRQIEILGILEALPSAQPEFNKQELIRTMNAGIIATDAKDVYSCGMRNGIRWCRALLEDDPSTPNFEDASQYAQPKQTDCIYCHEDSDGYVTPLEKNCHAFIRFGMNGWELSLKANGWHGSAKIRYCPMCGRKLKNDK